MGIIIFICKMMKVRLEELAHPHHYLKLALGGRSPLSGGEDSGIFWCKLLALIIT